MTAKNDPKAHAAHKTQALHAAVPKSDPGEVHAAAKAGFDTAFTDHPRFKKDDLVEVTEEGHDLYAVRAYIRYPREESDPQAWCCRSVDGKHEFDATAAQVRMVKAA